MKAQALLRVSLTVGDLARAAAFYTGALGFIVVVGEAAAEPALVRLLGAASVRTVLLRRGDQMLELASFDPPGAAYPRGSASNDGWFQHCALPTTDMAASYARLTPFHAPAISRDGPETLPGGIVAFKFRDPDGHPLELIQFPSPNPVTAGGIDHSAIAVADANASAAFYAQTLNLAVAARQVNTGPAQDALDGLDGTLVDVVALAPTQPAPHVELLGYRHPAGRRASPMRPADIAASRLILQVDRVDGEAAVLEDGTLAALRYDPDGHALLLLQLTGD